jgi:cytochrome c-type biogenesis protein CcmH/NrfG
MLAGYSIGVSKGMEAMAGRPGPVAAAPPGMGMPPPGAGAPPAAAPGMISPQQLAEAQQRIAMTQQLVARDPKNVQAWIALGNDYFDTHQAQKAIDAYAAALKLQPANPDVLTDQGVMYQQLADYDHALANFEQAQKIEPRHMQSLYNIGVIWAHNKHDGAKAAAAWKKVIELAPTSPQATEARAGLAGLGK